MVPTVPAPRGKLNEAPKEVPKRERILTAAVEEFSEKGFAAARIDEIASRSNANKQLIYYYFNSKSGLYDAVLERMIETYKPLWDELKGVTLEDMIEKRGRSGTDGDRVWRRLLAWEGVEYWNRKTEPIHLEDLRTQAYRIQTEIIERTQELGDFPQEIDPSVASLLLIFASLGPDAYPQVTKMVTGMDADDPRLRASITASLKFFVHGLAKNDAPPDAALVEHSTPSG